MSHTVDDPLSLANLLRPEVRADPYPFYARLRESDPVHRDESGQFWVLTRYADVVAALHDPRVTKADGLRSVLPQLPADDRSDAEIVYGAFGKMMLYADPPYHTRLRNLANRAFTSRTVDRLRPRIEEIVNDLLDRVLAAGHLDVISQFAYPLPAMVIMEILGLPAEQRDRFKQWSDDLFAAIGIVRRDPAAYRRARTALPEVMEHFGAVLAERRRQPGDDLLSALVHSQDGHQTLSDEELALNSVLLLAAAHENTTNLIGNGLLALLRHPDQMQRLREEPRLTAGAVEEFMRYDNPAQVFLRYAADDVEFGGKCIPKGQIINLVAGAANRDPAAFADPDCLDVTRSASRHLGFGLGIHFCIGAPLARMEVEIAFCALLRRLTNIRLAGSDLQWQPNPTFRALKALPVSVGNAGNT